MNCREVREQLELAVLDELPAARQADVRAHLDTCADCRTAEAEYRFLLRDIRLTARRPAPDAEFERRVRTAVRTELGVERRPESLARSLSGVALAAALLLVVLISGLMSRPAVDTGRQAAAAPADDGRAATAAGEKWRYKSAQGATGSIAEGILVQGRTMYLLRQERLGASVAAIDAATGEARWQSETQSIGYLAADSERVFSLARVRPQAVDLVALDASDGRPVWRYSQKRTQPLPDFNPPVPLAGGRVCWTMDSTVHMLDSRTGDVIWTRSLPGEGPLSAAAVEQGKAYVASAGVLHCLRAESGDELWAERLDGSVAAEGRPVLAAARGRIHVARPCGRLESQLACLSIETRKPLWTKTVPRVRYVLAADAAFCSRNPDDIRAFDPATGDALWTCKAGGCSPLTRVGGLIYFIDTTALGRVVAVDARTGDKAWELCGLRSCNAFAKVGDTGYIKTSDGIVHALALCSAKPL